MTYSDFISGKGLTENQIGVIDYLDKQFLMHENVHRTISYKVPFYVGQKRICYINPKKTGQIELCFMNGKPLSQVYHDIQMKDRKWTAGLMIDCDQDIDIEYVLEIFNYALGIDGKNDS